MCVIAAGYSYFIYPLLLLMLRIVVNTPSNKLQPSGEFPSLSLIITAHNEEGRIADKLQNSLAIDYPEDKIEIIVASDHSTDNTDEIVKGMGIKLVQAEVRKGKEYAQWLAVQQAKGDIIVFSDVATLVPRDAFYTIAEIFRDPHTGAVSSEDQFITENGRVVGEGLYVRYEMWLRKLESDLSGLVGLSGSFFAARREICENWDILAPSDFNTALNCITKGYIAVADGRLIGMYKDVKDSSVEYRRKVRTIIRGITAIYRKPEVLNPFKYGLFSFQVWGHKIMRWLVPWLMVIIFILSFLLYEYHLVYRIIFWLQMIFYGVVVIGCTSELLRSHFLVRIPYYFVQTNTAIAHATISFLSGKRVTLWTPSAR